MKSYRGIIKIDIDNVKELPEEFRNRLHQLRKFYNLQLIRIKKSTSKNGLHIIINSETDITYYEALLLQIFLFSDVKREYMNFLRILNNANFEKWNILFDKKFK